LYIYIELFNESLTQTILYLNGGISLTVNKKTFPISNKVTVEKVLFNNKYGIIIAADMESAGSFYNGR